ncbi:MAG TPA: Trk system potassium transporter TrkA [Candidatus Atribacteria bacterium]|nr:Trk system potassium transporter TrkA [Candidatus Atribacteria bacterium]
MKIIIIGDGKLGYNLAENLSKENNDVTIIDKNPEALKKAGEYLDVMCIKGNGLSTQILLEAGIKEADLLIAATASDETNMVCCLTAKKLGAAHTIARIRDPQYADELDKLKADLDLDMVINPEQAVASEIARLIEFPPALNIETFSKGQVVMMEMKVTPDMSIVNMSLNNISKWTNAGILIGGVLRDGSVVIPNGDFVIKRNDTIYIVGQPSKVVQFCKRIGIHVQRIKNVMVMGGGRIAYYLAKYLDEMDIRVKIIEIKRERCIELTELLPKALIVCGDGTDESLLHSENLTSMGAFVSVTDKDEENIIAALMAKQNGVQKVIAKINRANYTIAINNMGINSVVIPKLITANHILRYVRGLQNAMGDPVDALYRIMDGRVEAIEFTANEHTKFLDIPLKDLKIVKDILVASIVRKNEIIIPHGSDVIKADDKVILIAKDKKLTGLNDIVELGV